MKVLQYPLACRLVLVVLAYLRPEGTGASASPSATQALASPSLGDVKSRLTYMEAAAYDDYEEEDEDQPDPPPPSGGFSCQSCEQPDCAVITECHHAVRCYTSHMRDIHGNEFKAKGCVGNFQQIPLYCSTLFHDGKEVHKDNGVSSQFAFSCCKGHLCNNHTEWPTIPDVPNVLDEDYADSGESQTTSLDVSKELLLAVAIPIVILIVLATIILLAMRRCHRKRMDLLAKSLGLAGLLERTVGEADELVGLRAQVVGDSTLREFQNEESMTSGSGSGMPFLVMRTLAKQIRLGERIGKGRYGEVWRGEWNGDAVAVKIFFSRDEDSWRRETEIYSTVLLRHDNILGYVGSDCTSQNSCTQLWLVTHFYPRGSLYDFLNSEPHGLTQLESFTILISSLTGVVHLHTEIFGTQGKPAIAHRDLKTKNILIRDDRTCVIADFGLAVTHSETTGRLDEQQNSRVGTKRYMSPEVLDQSIERHKTIEAYRRVDIYSFALVMWEVLRRTRTLDSDVDSADDFALPFYNDVAPDPSFEEMRKVVCLDQRRPEMNPKWQLSPYLYGVSKIMQECWHENANVRLPALRIKKSMQRLNPARESSTSLSFPKGYSP